MERPELRPCPFCGSVDVENFGAYVRCLDCKADGPYAWWADDPSKEAAESWNRRESDRRVNIAELRRIADAMLYRNRFSGDAGAYIEKQAEKILEALGEDTE